MPTYGGGQDVVNTVSLGTNQSHTVSGDYAIASCFYLGGSAKLDINGNNIFETETFESIYLTSGSTITTSSAYVAEIVEFSNA